MPEGDEIGSKLSDNENVTVRFATQPAGIQQGGTWGRSKRPKTAAATTTSSSTRSASRAPIRPPPSAAGEASPEGRAGADGSSGSSTSGPPGAAESIKKPNGKGKNAAASGRKGGGSGGAAARVAASASASNGTTRGRAGGVYTLAGPLTPPAAGARGGSRGSGGSSRSLGAAAARGASAGAGGGSSPGQVRTLFGSCAVTPGRATGSSSRSSAGAAAARREGANAAPGGSSPSSAGGGPEPDAVATAVAAVAGETSGDGAHRKRPRGGTGVPLKSEGDIAERLLTAVGGGGKGTADRFFRKAMKLAVEKQYDQSRADARVRAALGGWYTAESSATQRRLGDGESVALNISFSKGAGSKSQLTETVDRIPREQVAAVVRMIASEPESREMLKPHNFAGCSPRMFWSLVQHWGGDVPAALRLAAPDVDWSFLDIRDRKPSEKAVANAAAAEAERREAEEERAERERIKRKRERRKRRKEGILTDSSDEGEEQLGAATASLDSTSPTDGEEMSEPASAASAAGAAADARARAANAALARLTASQQRPGPLAGGAGAAAVAAGSAAVATIVAASEGVGGHGAGGDRKEDGDKEQEKVEEVDMEGLVEVAGELGASLLAAAGVRTLGQLADRDDEELANQLAVLQQEEEDGGEAAATGGGAAAGGSSSNGERKKVGIEQVSEWVQAARGEELDEIMADIFGGDEDVIEAMEQVSVSTPRDLVRLGAFPDVLVGVVRDRLGAERFAPLVNRVTAEAVEAWRRQGDRLLEQRPWLELWVHEG